MKDRLSMLTEHLFGKQTLSDCKLSDIKQLANQYPWMAAARVLLVKKLEEEKDAEWLWEWNKASSLFEDQLWLDFLLNEPAEANTIDSRVSKAAINSAASLASPMMASSTGVSSSQEMVFEPFHTVDYFASQGIRFKPEEQPQDKLGKQLKSFTDWIKTMKKLPLSEIGKSVDPKEERKVEQLAGLSLEQQDVVTEAMAAIWVKQKNYAKAREVYHKLSLLEPAKSAYFASKINELNS